MASKLPPFNSNTMDIDTKNSNMRSANESLNNATNSSSASALVIAASDKAGMEGIDRARIDEIILRESGNSAYMKQQRKRDEAVNVKITQMKKRLAQQEQSQKSWRHSIEQTLQPEIHELLKSRRPRSTCVVVDMDMFYMACELLTRPDLENVPACVGTGMILTSNYCARRYGVRSAMAGWIADKLVSELTNGKQRLHHIPSNFELYTQKSHQVRAVLAEYDPQMRAYSLDEVYLDLAPYLSLRLDNPQRTHEQIRDALQDRAKNSGTSTAACVSAESAGASIHDDDDNDGQPEQDDDNISQYPSRIVAEAASKIVQEMREKVKQATGGLTCSAGLASNFMLAKIASDANKPNGQLVVGPSHKEILSFVHKLPTRKIPGIGRVTDKVLHAFGITTVQQLYEQRALVRFLFTPATAKFLLRASLGCSSNDHNGDEQSERKGISRERTFQSGRPWSEVSAKLEDITRKLSGDMKENNLRAHTITVKVKLDTFDVLSRSKTMNRGVYLQDGDELVRVAAELVLELKRQHKGPTFSVRLLGVRCSNFQGEEERDANQMNIERFLCKDYKRAASPTRASRAVSPTLTSKRKRPSSLPFAFPVDTTTCANAPLPLLRATLQETSSTEQQQEQQKQQHCPLCHQVIPRANQDNDAVNRHIDACLNSGMVRQAVQEESIAAATKQRDVSTTNKKQRLESFFKPKKKFS